MSETKKVWLIKFKDLNDSIYVITNNIYTAIEKGIKIYNESFSEELTEDDVASIKFICYAEE